MNMSESTCSWQVWSHDFDAPINANRNVGASRQGSVEKVDLVVTSKDSVGELRLVSSVNVARAC